MSTDLKALLVFSGEVFLLSDMYTVYAISSLSRSYIYIGMSSQTDIRISRHNKGQNKTTKPYAPFRLIYTRNFNTREEARAHEKYLKSGIGREFLRSLNE